MKNKLEKYQLIYNEASELMSMDEGEEFLEPTSALKECAANNGIQDGSEMATFIKWAHNVIDGGN
tara:strand:- start:564 stop:758 length:195 start_codon:yes stop_codon:yes gene_type:complete